MSVQSFIDKGAGGIVFSVPEEADMDKDDKRNYVQDDFQKRLVHNRPQPTTSPPKPRQGSGNAGNASTSRPKSPSGKKK